MREPVNNGPVYDDRDDLLRDDDEDAVRVQGRVVLFEDGNFEFAYEGPGTSVRVSLDAIGVRDLGQALTAATPWFVQLLPQMQTAMASRRAPPEVPFQRAPGPYFLVGSHPTLDAFTPEQHAALLSLMRMDPLDDGPDTDEELCARAAVLLGDGWTCAVVDAAETEIPAHRSIVLT